MPNGVVVTTPVEATDVVSHIGKLRYYTAPLAFDMLIQPGAPSMLKAQVLAGGRGKGRYNSDGKGGVRIVNNWCAPP